MRSRRRIWIWGLLIVVSCILGSCRLFRETGAFPAAKFDPDTNGSPDADATDGGLDTGIPSDDSGSSDVLDGSAPDGNTTDTGSDPDTDGSTTSCSNGGECPDGYLCENGECVACIEDSDCRPGEICVDGSCQG